MSAESLRPIPTPLAQRLRLARTSGLPMVVFCAALLVTVFLWKDRIGMATMVGQVDGELAQVGTHQAGVLTGLNVTRFQKVRRGDALGYVLVADPKLLESTLAVVRAEIDLLRADGAGWFTQKRYEVDYAQLRLNWMRQRADLATARVNLQLAEADLRRTEELHRDQIASPSELDLARTTRQALVGQVQELTALVTEGETAFTSLQQTNAAGRVKLDADPWLAALSLQEAKLREVEAQLSPVALRAPIDGTVTMVNHRSGESVTPGLPIVIIAADWPTRIVGYLRPPFRTEPKSGDMVRVQTRSGKRVLGVAQVIEVGSQLEVLPISLQTPLKLAGSELALPVNISLPPDLHLRPGEMVDVTVIERLD